jgi:hypothetical protein
MSTELFMAIVAIIPAIAFLFMIWAPTFFVVIRQKQSRYPRTRIYAYALPLELVTAAGLSLLVDWVGLLNPAAYAFVITIATGVIGAIATHHFSKAATGTSTQQDS